MPDHQLGRLPSIQPILSGRIHLAEIDITMLKILASADSKLEGALDDRSQDFNEAKQI